MKFAGALAMVVWQLACVENAPPPVPSHRPVACTDGVLTLHDGRRLRMCLVSEDAGTAPTVTPVQPAEIEAQLPYVEFHRAPSDTAGPMSVTLTCADRSWTVETPEADVDIDTVSLSDCQPESGLVACHTARLRYLMQHSDRHERVREFRERVEAMLE
ncbi:MAG: hypothetical protein ACO1OB_16685 [Archangium sp.]